VHLPDGIRSPQEEGQLDLFGIAVPDPVAHGGGLPAHEFSARALGTPLVGGQGSVAAPAIGIHPVADGLAGDAERHGGGRLPHAGQDGVDGAAALFSATNASTVSSSPTPAVFFAALAARAFVFRTDSAACASY